MFFYSTVSPRSIFLWGTIKLDQIKSKYQVKHPKSSTAAKTILLIVLFFLNSLLAVND